MPLLTLIIAALATLSGPAARSLPNRIPPGPDPDLTLWAEACFDFVRNLTCRDAVLTSEEDCERLASVPKSGMNFYAAEPLAEGRLSAVLPDGPLNRMQAPHDAVLVLDPYPAANLGHLLVVFFVDLGWSQLQCQVNGGRYLADEACLSLALRARCHNQINAESTWSRARSKTQQTRFKYCEVGFFPLVHAAGKSPSPADQRLRCRDDVNGFATCPTLRPSNATDVVMCNPVQTNSVGCGGSAHRADQTKCRAHARCDHAVLLSGGWDRLTDSLKYRDNLIAVHGMLQRNGFLQENIRMFYSNGEVLDDETYKLYPAAFKWTLRSHIRKLCRSPLCADSLLIYLNSPTNHDGSSLLWDLDGNGKAEKKEIYTIKELLFDTQNCAAEQVYMIADQNYAGRLVRQLEKSGKHGNVLAFASGREDEYSWNGDYTRHWVDFHHEASCVGDAHQVVQETMLSSQPITYDGSQGAINKTLFGAPCDVTASSIQQEFQNEYFRC